MKKKTIRIITLCLAAILLLGALAGCGKKDSPEDNGNKGNGNTDNPDTPEFVYLPDYVELSDEVGRINQCFAVGDKLYFTSYVTTGKVQELYPNDMNADPWYFTIDGDLITANRLDGGGGMVIYEDTEYVYAASAGVAVEPAPARAVLTPGTAEASESEGEPSEFELEKQAAIEKYIQYDEDGELIVPEGYEYWEYDKQEQVLMRMNVDGTGVQRLEDYALPAGGEDMESDGSLSALMGDREGRLWVSEQVYSYSYDKETGEYIDGGDQTFVRRLDENGGEAARVDLERVKTIVTNENGWFYVNSIALDKDDNVYVLSNGAIYVVDMTGNILFNVKSDNWINSMLTLSDGSVAATVYENDGQRLKKIDVAKKGWGESYKAPSNMYDCFVGSGDYDLYYNDGSCFYGYSMEKGEAEQIVNWINANINGDYVRSIVPLADGRIVVMLYNWNKLSGSSTEMAILSRQPYSALGNKTVLTLACMYDYELRDRVIEFNKKNDRVRIEVKNYSVYNNYDSDDPADYNAGVTKLNTEIISGTVPDLLVLDNLPAQQYMAKGLLEDLWPYIDGDGELGRGKLISSVLDAVSFDGKLYQTVKSFSVQTIACPKSVVGNITGWTLAEMRQFQDRMPAGSAIFTDMTRDNALQMFLMYGGADFIDWESGKCSFNSQGFIDLLEYCNTFPAEIDWEKYEYQYVPELTRLQEGSLLGEQMYLSDILSYLRMKTLFGGEIAVVGFPCESREGNLLNVGGGVAMSSKCRDKEAAWEFLRQDFLPRGDNDMYSYGLPINRADMDELVAEAMKKEYVKDENGRPVLQPITTWWMDNGTDEGYQMDIMPAEQADIDEFMAIIESAKPMNGYDQEVFDLIAAEAAAFFSNQKSARDVANVIQSKMQMYVNEHM